MSQPNPRTTGLFVLGAILLVVAGLVAFGSRSYFEHRPRAVTFFHGSVAGLVVGAPVTFRGVGVGSVLKILLQTNSTNGTAQIPVIMEFDPQRVTMIGGSDTAKFTERTKINGLGATLVMQSLITGQLAIELDYHDPTKVSSTGIDLGLPEIPEAEGGINAMKNTLSNLPELANSAASALRSVNELVSAPESHEILENLEKASKAAAETVASVQADAGRIASESRATAEAAHRATEHADALISALQPQLAATLTAAERLLAATDQRTAQIAGDVHTTLLAADRTLAELQATLGDIHAVISPRSTMIQDAQSLLHNLAAASGSLRSFADQVDRNPNALVMGRSSR
jgi:paraquat-inducible protein B